MFCEGVEEKSEKEESQEDISISSQRIIYKKVYNIKPNTQNIFYFDIKTRKIKERKVNFEKLSFEYFEENQSILNYKNYFYLNWGNNLNIFYKYDQNLNVFIKLKELLTVHSSYRIIGMGNYIYVISGSLSIKVDPNLKIDLSSLNNKWEKINLNYENEIKLRYNFGIINLMNNSFLIIGGKEYNENNSEINNSLRIMINNKKIDIEKEQDLILYKNKEFNGKSFAYFGDWLYGEFSSVSYRTFYLINILSKTIEEIN